MKRILLFALLGLFALPAFGGTKACTSQMVTANICRVETNYLLFFDAPVAFWISMANQICESQGYSATLENGDPNPMNCNQFAQGWIRSVFINIEKSGRARVAADDARDVVLAEPDADVGDGS